MLYFHLQNHQLSEAASYASKVRVISLLCFKNVYSCQNLLNQDNEVAKLRVTKIQKSIACHHIQILDKLIGDKI